MDLREKRIFDLKRPFEEHYYFSKPKKIIEPDSSACGKKYTCKNRHSCVDGVITRIIKSKPRFKITPKNPGGIKHKYELCQYAFEQFF